MKLNSFRKKILRRFLKEKEKTIHIEAFVRDDVWQKIKDLVGKNYVWFITTPANYDYCKSYFNLRITKDEFRKILEKRVEYLKKYSEEIQLHIHLCNVKGFLDKQLQDEKFEEAMKFMNSVNLEPIKFAPGWNTYDDYTIEIAKKYGIKYLYVYSKNPLDKPKIRDGIIINFYYKFWHDYEFI